ncbi:hypothetical protein ACRAWB_15150 [Leifsonia poae]|uniref:hypothetical protein n=1 Tax=Leifsonia poae TaxID=110933 RepID=UPI003D690C10
MTTDTRARRLRGLPDDPAVRRRLLTLLIWGAVLAVPAAGLFAVALLTTSSLSYGPSWGQAGIPAWFLRDAAESFLLGMPVGATAASGAAVALLIYTARGGSRRRPVIAALGTLFASIIVGFVLDITHGSYPLFTVIYGVPGGILGAGLAAGYVAWANAASRRAAA